MAGKQHIPESALSQAVKDGRPPAVPCDVTWSEADGGWVVTVRRCPFCGGWHRHGAGLGAYPEMGMRLPPCGDASRYRLVLTPRTRR